MSTVGLPTYDVFVLSGGGAKGAYGAGAAKALAVSREKKGVRHPICFVGASAGALNAAILASYQPDEFLQAADELLKFWREANNRNILGNWIPWQKFQFFKANMLNWIPCVGRRPFYVYSNAALRKLIESKTKRLAEAIQAQDTEHHLIVAVTDYTEGSLKAFYYSPTFAKCVDYDRLFANPKTSPDPKKKPRLDHCHLLGANILVDVLLASAAIPVFFPPVKIGSNLYIDGGVGNNTPTREAAYFFRYIEERKWGVMGQAYCVLLDEPRRRQDELNTDRLLGIVQRTLDIYHYVHMKPIISAWSRINHEVDEHRDRLLELLQWAEDQGWGPSMVAALDQKIKAKNGLWDLGGIAARVSAPLRVVEPSMSLGDTLNFSPASIKRNIETGYLDMLKAIYPQDDKGNRNREYDDLKEKPI